MPRFFSGAIPEGLKGLTGVLRDLEGYSALAAALARGESGVVDGAWGSAAPLAAACLAQDCQGTLLIVIPHPGDLDAWAEDLDSFAGERPLLFPAWDQLPAEPSLSDEVLGRRLRALKRLRGAPPPRVLLATIQAAMQPVPDPHELARQARRLAVGEVHPLDELARWMLEQGLTRRETVELPGEFSRRGGILDVFPADADAPFRIEFFGDEIESIRRFAPETQRSLDQVRELEILTVAAAEGPGRPPPAASRSPGLAAHLPPSSWVVLVEPDELAEQGKHYLERTPDPRGLYSVQAVFQHLVARPSVTVTALPAASVETTVHLRVESVERFSGDVRRVRQELEGAAAGGAVLVACHNEAERQRLTEILKDEKGDGQAIPRIQLVLGHVRAGFRLVDPGILVLSDHELFHRAELPARRPAARRYEVRAIDSFLDLEEGDLVVHVSHGIARFLGMQVLENKGQSEEHLVLEFAAATKLYVPASKIDLVQKYVGGARGVPELSRLGGLAWQRRKQRVQEALLDLASDMIDLQALRESQPGLACPADSDGQLEFEATFPYQETPDQLTALAEIKADMQRPRPMDRLVCGDVGYGKTELAVRAAFKMMDFGKQVAVLVPTTVLAEQHFRTFGGRLAEYPFNLDCLSRFRSPAEQRAILERLAEGRVDLVIGTHRLLSADVKFKDLGLVIIDEEQRFGVEHKERLKKLRATVDVLTLTATPIPRTLHLSLLGIRDISNLETPPQDRLAIETRVVRYDPVLIRHAVLRELNREGQIYFVHNRVHNIQNVADELQAIVPEARLAIVHGQMHEHDLEDAMFGFVRRESDILVATTIIESGLDIPNVNTIFINQADQYGLADLHQLRGRVGRYKHRAYCYLLLDAGRSLSPVALRRLKAIEEFTELGAGFKIAMRDLEIRGAGNILGTQQSGHIAAVGYELYCQLLENSVRRLKNQPARPRVEAAIDLPWQAYLPRDYVPGQRQRIEVYRRLSRIEQLDRLADFRQELADRFGPVPEKVEGLLQLQELRILALRWQVAAMHLENSDLVLTYRNRKRIERLAEQSRKRLRVVDDQSAYLRLRSGERETPRLYQLLKALLQSMP